MTGSAPRSGFGKAKAALDAATARELAGHGPSERRTPKRGGPQMGGQGGEAHLQPVRNWRFHDFRRTGVTWLADAGFPPNAADRLLNHVAGSIRGVAAIYRRGDSWRTGGRRWTSGPRRSCAAQKPG